MEYRDLILVICAIGAVQSFFWGVYLAVFDKRTLSTKLLGTLFIALAARIIKSTLWLFSPSVNGVILNIGFAAHLMIGPLLLLYLQSLSPSFKIKWWHGLHFLPFLIVAAMSTTLTLNTFWYQGGYTFLLFQSLSYLLAAGLFLVNNYKRVMPHQLQWAIMLISGVGIVLVAYFTNYQYGINTYASGPLVYAGVIYLFSFYLLRNISTLFSIKKKYKNINLSGSQSRNYKEKIQQHFLTGKPYLDNNYTLSTLSEDLKIPKHLLSNVFSKEFGMSFTDYVNSKRIAMAKIKLLNEQHLTIASIAYDCGFNTLSSFNQAFKKFVNTTPSKFRNVLPTLD